MEIPIVRFEDWCLSQDSICFTGVEEEDPRFLLVAKMSEAQSTGISSGWDKAVIISPDRVPDWGDIDLKADYDGKCGAPSVGNPKVFFKYYFVNTATGEKSSQTQSS